MKSSPASKTFNVIEISVEELADPQLIRACSELSQISGSRRDRMRQVKAIREKYITPREKELIRKREREILEAFCSTSGEEGSAVPGTREFVFTVRMEADASHTSES